MRPATLSVMCLAALAAACASGAVGAGPTAGGPPLDTADLEGTAREQMRAAIQLIDQHDLENAEQLLRQMREAHPHNLLVLHELALVHRMGKNPAAAVELLSPYESQLPGDTLAALGSAYSESGDPARALEALRAGVERLPDSGILWSELGTTLVNGGKPPEALAAYEEGIARAPGWGSNYLRSAEIYAHFELRAQALLHGEVFRVLEPTSQRSAQMGGVLVKLMAEAIQVNSDKPNEVVVALVPAESVIEVDPAEGFKLPTANAFELVFAPFMVNAAAPPGFSLEALHSARTEFVEQWWRPQELYDPAAHPVFGWQRELIEAGHFEAYNYWLFGPAFPEEFGAWHGENKAAMDGLIEYVETKRFPTLRAERAR